MRWPLHPSGNYVYVANEMGNSVSAFSVNTSTGAVHPAGGHHRQLGLPAAQHRGRPDGPLRLRDRSGGSGVAAYRINSSTGALTVVGYIRTGGAAESVAVHPNGQFVYAVTRSSDALAVFSINPITGALTSAGTPVATGSNPGRLAVNTAGSRVYVCERRQQHGVGLQHRLRWCHADFAGRRGSRGQCPRGLGPDALMQPAGRRCASP